MKLVPPTRMSMAPLPSGPASRTDSKMAFARKVRSWSAGRIRQAGLEWSSPRRRLSSAVGERTKKRHQIVFVLATEVKALRRKGLIRQIHP